ncbi:MAG: hypothetical protein IPJ65_03800 [Archangiaceae bacterium]|nr:hypothetical protein [Archangiaceae bacterium]
MRRLLTLALVAVVGCARAPATCTDGVRNGQEADVDCGGPDCRRCASGDACQTPDDCESGRCQLHVCVAAVEGCDGGPQCAGVECRRNAECPSGACLDGQCVPPCAAPLVPCGGACVDAQNDPAHCGGCGVGCRADQRCAGGACVSGCPVGTLACPVGPGVACVDTGVDVLHCGGCTVMCQPGQRCAQGQCRLDCAPFQTACFGECVSTATDALHCGGCGRPCAPGEVCSMGECGPACRPPTVACDAGFGCADLRFDPLNCGACGVACPPVPHARPLCLGTLCSRTACDVGFADCNGLPFDGCEAELATDALNCGACGRSCVPGTCFNGMCP